MKAKPDYRDASARAQHSRPPRTSTGAKPRTQAPRIALKNDDMDFIHARDSKSCTYIPGLPTATKDYETPTQTSTVYSNKEIRAILEVFFCMRQSLLSTIAIMDAAKTSEPATTTITRSLAGQGARQWSPCPCIKHAQRLDHAVQDLLQATGCLRTGAGVLELLHANAGLESILQGRLLLLENTRMTLRTALRTENENSEERAKELLDAAICVVRSAITFLNIYTRRVSQTTLLALSHRDFACDVTSLESSTVAPGLTDRGSSNAALALAQILAPTPGGHAVSSLLASLDPLFDHATNFPTAPSSPHVDATVREGWPYERTVQDGREIRRKSGVPHTTAERKRKRCGYHVRLEEYSSSSLIISSRRNDQITAETRSEVVRSTLALALNAQRRRGQDDHPSAAAMQHGSKVDSQTYTTHPDVESINEITGDAARFVGKWQGRLWGRAAAATTEVNNASPLGRREQANAPPDTHICEANTLLLASTLQNLACSTLENVVKASAVITVTQGGTAFSQAQSGVDELRDDCDTHTAVVESNAPGHIGTVIRQAYSEYISSLGVLVGTHPATDFLEAAARSDVRCLEFLRVLTHSSLLLDRHPLSWTRAISTMQTRRTKLDRACQSYYEPQRSTRQPLGDRKDLVNSASLCVTSANDCLAETISMIKRMGDFDLGSTLDLRLSALNDENLNPQPRKRSKLNLPPRCESLMPFTSLAADDLPASLRIAAPLRDLGARPTQQLRSSKSAIFPPSTEVSPIIDHILHFDSNTTSPVFASDPTFGSPLSNTIAPPTSSPQTSPPLRSTASSFFRTSRISRSSRPRPDTIAGIPYDAPQPASRIYAKNTESETALAKTTPQLRSSGSAFFASQQPAPSSNSPWLSIASTGLFQDLPSSPVINIEIPRLSTSEFWRSGRMDTSPASKTTRSGSFETSLSDTNSTRDVSTLRSSQGEPSSPSTLATTPEVTLEKDFSPRPLHDSCGPFWDTDPAPTENKPEVNNAQVHNKYCNELSWAADGRLRGGTLRALVERLTPFDRFPDQDLLNTFYLTFRCYSTPMNFAKALIHRYEHVGQSATAATPVRLRVYNIFKGWLEGHWRSETDVVALEVIARFALGSLRAHLPTASKRLMELIDQASDKHFRPLLPRSISHMGKINTSFNPSPTTTTPPTTASITKTQLHTLKNAKSGKSTCSILDFDPLELARQATHLQSSVYRRIEPEELVAQEWRKGSHSTSYNVKALSTMTTDLGHFVSDTILTPTDPQKRANIIKHWTKVATHARVLANYEAVKAILVALDSSPIHRLRKTWALVTPRSLARLEELKPLMDSSHNWANLRDAMAVQQAPCVPSVSNYLTDLAFADEGNPPLLSLPGVRVEAEVINIDKHLLASRIMADMLRFQAPYSIVVVPELSAWLETELERARAAAVGDGDAGEAFWRRSLVVEPRERVGGGAVSGRESWRKRFTIEKEPKVTIEKEI